MRDESSAETAAAIQILTQEILYEISAPGAADLASRITVRLEQALYRERERCVAICKRRAVVWSNTLMASSPLGREESRARTNEATYIADAIRALSES
jgi:hypothetical protein